MNHALRKTLALDERDPGCDAGIEILDRFVEIELGGGDPAEAFPDTAAHLRSCDGCQMDKEGLLEAARKFGDATPAD